jgi:1,4-alpha-glucan branching enzyme
MASVTLSSDPQCSEDYWTPSVEVPPGHAYIEEYGTISPVPAHDGTDCFRWDNTLWSASEHFK